MYLPGRAILCFLPCDTTVSLADDFAVFFTSALITDAFSYRNVRYNMYFIFSLEVHNTIIYICLFNEQQPLDVWKLAAKVIVSLVGPKLHHDERL